MPGEPLTPSPEGSNPSERTHFASSDHPSGDTWRKNDEVATRSADSFAPGQIPPRHEVIGDFEVIGRLGQGGMGMVYRARQISLDRQVALKLLPVNLEADAEYVARFQREARLAASLHHPNLVKVFSYGVVDGSHYIAMELVEGETLAQWVKRGALPLLDALRIVLQVAQALDCGWRTANLIHRDIKPGNIFLSDRGDVKLGDLGLAKVVGGDTTGLTQTGSAMGTPHYISPEQARGEKDLDFRADIYSLGCTLFQMLTGRTPYSGTEPMVVMGLHVNAPPPAILKVMPQCPIPLARLVGRMLKKQRRERHGSYEELIAQIEAVRASLDPSLVAAAIPQTRQPAPSAHFTPASPLAIPSMPTGTMPKRGMLYGGIGAGFLVLGIIGWVFWPKEEKLTTAQRYALDHAGKQQADTEAVVDPKEHGQLSASPSQPPSDGAAEASIIGNVGANAAVQATDADWHDWVKEKRSAGRFVQNQTFQDDGRSIRVKYNTMLGVSEKGFIDGEIRATWTIPPLSSSPNRLFVRRFNGSGKRYRRYQATMTPSDVSLQKEESDEAGSAKIEVLRKWSYPADFQITNASALALRAKGSTLTAILNGQELGSVEIESDARPGEAGIFLGQGTILQNLEYRSLDKKLEAGNSNPASAAAPWKDLLHGDAKLALLGAAEQTSEGVRFSDTGSVGPANGIVMRDGAVRIRTPFAAAHPKIRLRRTDAGNYQLGVKNANAVCLEIWDNVGKRTTTLRDFALSESLNRGVDYELELRAVGQTLTAKCNGVVLGSVTDGTFLSGTFGVGVTERNHTEAFVSRFESLDLDSP